MARRSKQGAASVAASNARRVLGYGQSRGFALPARNAQRLPHADDPLARIPAAQMFALWEELASGLDAPDLPIALALRSRLEDLELLGFVVLTAPTLAAAFRAFAHYSPLLNDGGRWELALGGDHLEMQWYGSDPLRLGVRLSHETAVAQMVNGVRQLFGPDIDPVRVSLRHGAPATLRAHREFLCCPLEFDAPLDRVAFRRELAEAVPPGANEALWRYLRAQADQRLEQLAPRSLSERVRQEIERTLALGEQPAMVRLAHGLQMSERTLRRALSAEHLRFGELVDEARRARATILLERGDRSITRIALDAGYSDTSAFTHACQRWFGKSPSELTRGDE